MYATNRTFYKPCHIVDTRISDNRYTVNLGRTITKYLKIRWCIVLDTPFSINHENLGVAVIIIVEGVEFLSEETCSSACNLISVYTLFDTFNSSINYPASYDMIYYKHMELSAVCSYSNIYTYTSSLGNIWFLKIPVNQTRCMNMWAVNCIHGFSDKHNCVNVVFVHVMMMIYCLAQWHVLPEWWQFYLQIQVRDQS